jgi:hypothetical protein
MGKILRLHVALILGGHSGPIVVAVNAASNHALANQPNAGAKSPAKCFDAAQPN